MLLEKLGEVPSGASQLFQNLGPISHRRVLQPSGRVMNGLPYGGEPLYGFRRQFEFEQSQRDLQKPRSSFVSKLEGSGRFPHLARGISGVAEDRARGIDKVTRLPFVQPFTKKQRERLSRPLQHPVGTLPLTFLQEDDAEQVSGAHVVAGKCIGRHDG